MVSEHPLDWLQKQTQTLAKTMVQGIQDQAEILGKTLGEALPKTLKPEQLAQGLLRVLSDVIREKTRLDRLTLAHLVDRTDTMTGEEFEQFLALCFQQLGYRVELTPKSNDFGADLILRKNGQVSVVQAKRYGKKVGSGAVQEVVAALKYYGGDRAIVITNNHFTASAQALAQPNGVLLWGREQLVDLILQAQGHNPKECTQPHIE